ncbi:F-box domain-containing protein [Mycena venus]|uniref:F-box domain-containing protein n=1 Tax=Mycena venus TaxID=2733690 RepID=A0A8H7DBU7_9AGAR|nr:F-box domain-containing protein [Mycena venus]
MRSDLEASRIRLTDIEAQILVLEHSISTLRAEKALVQEMLESYKYPVLTLPNEIMSEVFIHFLPVYPLCPPLTGVLSPTCLTQICRQWREIALTTPLLWRAIRLSGYLDIPIDILRHIFDVWLARSACCFLSIDIGQLDGVNLPEIFSTVLLHRARLEYLKLHLRRLLPPMDEGSMPVLRHLDLAFDQNLFATVAFREVPLLRTVVLNDAAAAIVTLPWEQLTSLTLRYVFPVECSPVLQRAVNLVHCELYLIGSESGRPWPDITLLHLKSLAFDGRGDYVSGFLDTIVVPALRYLKIPGHPGSLASLGSFISKSRCTLQEVHITGQRDAREAFYWAAFPSIPQFSFEFADGGEMVDDSGAELEMGDDED